ncbi:MAG: DNA translocase FtsK [Megasphaera massiliensis]|uniref:FtsK/SpoIIIE family DNA translocase n=1 Tax=Megasphaera TaxID=906 RepID=UPI001CD4BD8D|nr:MULTISPECIES: DNA translocase FtsK [Megasphaera]MBS5212307.1 DNA translocase FtsK [Megasphaera sp.]MCB5735797.1 DNA translocase FtsK [Megasphaera massiliensis]UBS53217.1 DNA translocase FtsK [Megasphaera massiliensis]
MANGRTPKSPRRKRTTRRTRTAKRAEKSPLLKYEIIGIFCILFGVFATVGFMGIDTGRIGHNVDNVLSYIFGLGRIVVSLSLVVLGLKYIVVRKACPVSRSWLIGTWIYVLLLGLIHLLVIPEGTEFLPSSLSVGGGIIGAVVSSVLQQFLGFFGAFMAIVGAAIVTFLIWKNWSISQPVAVVADKAGQEAARVSGKAVEGLQDASQSLRQWHEKRKIFDFQALDQDPKEEPDKAPTAVPEAEPEGIQISDARDLGNGVEEVSFDSRPIEENLSSEAADDYWDNILEQGVDDMEEAPDYSQIHETVVSDAEPTAHDVQPTKAPSLAEEQDVLSHDMDDIKPIEVEQSSVAVELSDEGSSAVPKAEGKKMYRLPSVSILKPGPQHTVGLSDEVRENAAILKETLQSFNIDAKILNASQGPSITRYELEPAAGVKVSKIVHLADDIALKLAATDIRIEAPIPGKAAVGIEVPNKKLTGVNLRDVIESETFQKAARGVPVCLGKDIAGNPIVADLTKMPHLLVAGSTGSGKSVCINTFIASILFKQRPEDVKLILIDPKVVELSNYNGIPHLLTPVVTDPKKAASVLRWAVREMDDRYKRFALTHTRDISRYNELHPEETMPFIVIIIDELADLMMMASDDVEKSIIRLGQKARACGMHLVLATQRPSVDVLTGLIKANVPSRIAFAVSSQVDSRTILDMAGADKLIGKGDMLFYPLGASKPLRVQGAFISDSEIDEMVEFIKGQDGPHYDESVQKAQSDNAEDSVDFFEDDLMRQAIDMVLETGQASTSMLQRRFRIGYTRAARMIDMMEAMHIVGPNNGSKPRDILMTADEVQQKYLG